MQIGTQQIKQIARESAMGILRDWAATYSRVVCGSGQCVHNNVHKGSFECSRKMIWILDGKCGDYKPIEKERETT